MGAMIYNNAYVGGVTAPAAETNAITVANVADVLAIAVLSGTGLLGLTAADKKQMRPGHIVRGAFVKHTEHRENREMSANTSASGIYFVCAHQVKTSD